MENGCTVYENRNFSGGSLRKDHGVNFAYEMERSTCL